jgi:hypothetical protein
MSESSSASASRSPLEIHGWSDADWAKDELDAKSITGIVLQLAGAAVMWVSRKQSNVALSTAEAEYIAASEAAKDMYWLRLLLSELGETQTSPSTLCVDSTSAISFTKEEVNQQRRRHINTKYHHIRELIANRTIQLKWVPTALQKADLMTKAFARERFAFLRALVMGHETDGVVVP